MARDKVIYRETYEPVPFKKECFPVLKHSAGSGKKFEAIGCELRAAGIIERNGIRLEYHDLRVYVDVKK